MTWYLIVNSLMVALTKVSLIVVFIIDNCVSR
jgi:hypothetical protein